MPKVPYPYEVNGKLVTGNGSLIPICSLSNRSLLPSLTVSVSKTCLRRGGRGAQKAQKCAFVVHEWSLSAPLGFLFVLIFAKPSQKQKGGNEVMAPCFFEETLTFVATLLPCSYFSMMPYTSAY